MQEDLYINLLYKKCSGQLEPLELQQLEQWLNSSSEHQQIAEAVEKSWELSANYTTDVDVDPDQEFEFLQQKIHKADEFQERSEAKVRTIFPNKWRIAAAVLLLVTAGFLLRNFLSQSHTTWKELAFAEKQTEALTLSDGSKIWANANATFHYPETFNSKERRVKLTGEAFFDVMTDANRPFIIETPTGTIQVLGTSFNVRDNAGESAMTVQVAKGKVQVRITETNESVTLEKGEQSIYNRATQSLDHNTNQVENAMAWHTGNLRFKSIPFQDALTTIEEFYNVKIQLKNTELAACLWSSRFNNMAIETVLDKFQEVFGVTIEQHQGTYLLKGGTCKNE